MLLELNDLGFIVQFLGEEKYSGISVTHESHEVSDYVDRFISN